MEFDFILNAYVQWRKLQMNILLFIAGKFIFLWVKLTRSFKKKSTNDVKGKNPLNSDDTERD